MWTCAFWTWATCKKWAATRSSRSLPCATALRPNWGKKIQRILKDSKLKVQGSIQGDSVRVTGAKRDDLQTAMALLKKEITDVPLSFNNFRD